MKIFKDIARDFISFFNLKTKRGLWRTAGLLLLLLAIVYFASLRDGSAEDTPETILRTVETGTVDSISDNNSFSLIGQVESVNQANIKTEAAGQVTAVYVELGQELRAGQVIGELENRSQYASLLQAEGAYEAALAAAASSDISVASAENGLTTAKNGAISTYRSGYTTINSLVLDTLDIFYSELRQNSYGVRIDSNGQAIVLSERRANLEQRLTDWQNKSAGLRVDDDLQANLTEAESITKEVQSLIDVFITLTNDADKTDTLNGQSVNSYTTTLTTARGVVDGVLASFTSATTNLSNAEKTLTQAKIGGTNNTELSAANAQVKQALGALRAAEANYQKSIIRTPIAGTLNELRLKTGDFVTQYTEVALVANNNALEVTTYVGDFDASRISVGQTVTLNKTVEGVVTAIAPTVDSVTKKTEVKIGTESDSLKTGDSVTVTFTQAAATTEDNSNAVIFIPITAVKFTASDGYIFTVEDNTLVSHPVSIGAVNGGYIEIVEGLDQTTEFVIDARGLSDGQKVEAISK